MHIHMRMCTDMHIVQKFTVKCTHHIFIETHMYTHTQPLIDTHSHTYKPYICTHINTYEYLRTTHIHTDYMHSCMQAIETHVELQSYEHTWACTFKHYTYTHIHTFMFTYTHIQTDTQWYICKHEHTLIYTHIHMHMNYTDKYTYNLNKCTQSHS